ncbi:MAG: abortive infection family protein [Pseudomonadota bacterium]
MRRRKTIDNSISTQTRNNIFDGLRIEGILYCGELGDIAFLSRLYLLDLLPSTDQRFETAEGDIWQHRENNFDWEDDWVFSDRRFDLLHCPDQKFLDFLCETVHPVVRPNKESAQSLVAHYNDQIADCGWNLVPEKKIAGRSVFVARKLGEFRSQIDRARSAAQVLTSNWMQSEIERINSAVNNDPALAIGTAKDLIESCCKAILAELESDVRAEKADDLPTLTKKLCRELALVPEGVPAEAKGADQIKRTLQNLASITHGIASLRGLYGSGHGRGAQHVGLQPRHARLAAASAIAFVDFVTETYLERKKKNTV